MKRVWFNSGLAVNRDRFASGLWTHTRFRSHIGFEVEGLEALCKKLEARGFTFESPYEWIPERKIAHATLIDPWGTQIEFTEGLDGL